MWAVVEAGLCTMVDLQTRLTLDDYISAWEYLAHKNSAMQQAQDRARQQAQMEQMARAGHRGSR